MPFLGEVAWTHCEIESKAFEHFLGIPDLGSHDKIFRFSIMLWSEPPDIQHVKSFLYFYIAVGDCECCCKGSHHVVIDTRVF